MMTYKVTLLMSEFVTHDVKRFVVSRPKGFQFEPGQGVEIAINKKGWEDQGRPFTPTNLADDEVLEFVIKAYQSHEGVTRELHRSAAGEELLMSDPFGTIAYQGPGVILAGGAGITPFLAILRRLAAKRQMENMVLFFSNKTPADIICEKELRHYLGDNATFATTQTESIGYENRRINKAFLSEKITDFDQPFYVCGPSGFMTAVIDGLKALGADPQSLVFEQ